MKNNSVKSRFHWIYLVGFFIILALPILAFPPYFFPPDWGKSIPFRSILAVLLFLFIFQLFFRKKEISLPAVKTNIIFWILSALFTIYLLATIFSVDSLLSLWGNPSRGGGFVTFTFYLVFAILAFILLKKDDWKKAWNFSIIIGVLVSLGAIIQYYGLFYEIFVTAPGRPSSTMGNPILLAMYLLLLSFVTLSFGIKEKTAWKKVFYFSSLALFLYVILIAGSRAAYLGLATGAIYFFLLYPRKIKAVKISVVCLIILAGLLVFYVNSVRPDQYPKFLQQNKLFSSVSSRLFVLNFLNDQRFHAWAGVDYKIILDKPIFGFGPENFSVGFDKFYDPSIPYLGQNWGDWWDRAHNVLINTASEAGIFALIVYLSLFVVLFWKLKKLKTNWRGSTLISENPIIPHGIQATLIGYLVANFFSFDSFSTYLIFFMLIGYSLHLIYNRPEMQNETQKNQIQKNKLWKAAVVFVLFCILIIFLWQYDLVPLQINAQINTAEILANSKQCDKALSLMEKTLKQHSFLDSYERMQYVEFTKACVNFYPDNKFSYIKRGFELIQEAVKTQPLYTRYWLSLGDSTTSLASQEQVASAKNNLLKQANDYFDKALQLGPKHQEIRIGQTKMEIIAGDYKSAENYAKGCIALDPGFRDCYWYLGLAEIYAKDMTNAQKNIQIASDKFYEIGSKSSLGELSDAYISISDYQDLVSVYQQLIKTNPNAAQYHSSLAFIYKELGKYAEARQEALKALELSPESKPNVDAFLKSLPY